MRRLIIPHQPKTAGTFASKCLPTGYVQPHNKNFHYLKNNNLIKDSDYLGCITRDPLDYYISLITFWCLDRKFVASGKIKEIEKVNKKDRLSDYERLINKQEPQTDLRDHRFMKVRHPCFFMSKAFTLTSVEEILERLFDEEFIESVLHIVSKNHCTYDYAVFREMKRLNIGYYTFAFLDQHSEKKVNEIESNEECFQEVKNIKKTFNIFSTKNIKKELQSFCEIKKIPFKAPKNREMKSNRKSIESYNFSSEIIKKIQNKDKYLI